MTLTTHAVVGATVASFFPASPAWAAAAFCFAFASHFALDAIPHWDYPIHSSSVNPEIGDHMKLDKALLLDIVSIGSDGALGILIACFLFWPASPAHLGVFFLALLGAFAGILPDALQFVYGHFRHEPLLSLQRFHKWIHTDFRFKESPLIGISTQVVFLAAFIAIVVSFVK